MSDITYLLISVVVFIMLVLGIFLTIQEFKKLEEEHSKD